MVQALDKNLAHFAALIKRTLNIDIDSPPGAGAAGGMGAGLLAFTNATMKRGIELVVEATKLDEYMKGASLAITGEGRVDFQTAFGKTPSGVAASARRHGVPVVAIGGGLADDANGVFQHGIDAILSATANPMPLDAALQKARQYLQDAGERAARLIVVGQKMAANAAPNTSDEKPADTAAAKSNGTASHSEPRLEAKRNKPVKNSPRAKRLLGLTPAALALSERRRTRET
jgi:glycerate 2-kinase